MGDKCHLCLLGLIILSSLLKGTSGVDETHVFISSGENVRLPCNNHLHDCKSTTWFYNRHSAADELIVLGKKMKNTERYERLSLGSDCSLNIKNIIQDDSGLYSCRQYVNDTQQGTDARVYLHVLHVPEISAGSSVTLYCLLYSYSYSFSYTGVSCDDWIRSEGIQLFWVNQAGVKPIMSDSRYQILFSSGHCISTLTTTLLNEDENREWRCEVTHRNQAKTSAKYTVKSSAQDDSVTAVIPVSITKSTTTTAATSTREPHKNTPMQFYNFPGSRSPEKIINILALSSEAATLNRTHSFSVFSDTLRPVSQKISDTEYFRTPVKQFPSPSGPASPRFFLAACRRSKLEGTSYWLAF
ncbi:Ig kappa chain V-II region VKappa167 [Labeo rohita]|uniref:Ig kappa chain V-II region VKappa167 n=1 Tax=Labeo rohita TaxID=84645 RepID=A0ABQ8MV87_LABRO|nr:Ig kappa chain V-II region VKappa167 [Labeo rohita]